MRVTRILAAVVAAIASFALVLSTAPVNAESPVSSERTVSSERAATSAQAPGFEWFNTKVNKKQTAWVAKGKAITWKRKAVQIQRKPANGGAWKTVKTVKTGPTGNFRTTLKPRRDVPCTGAHFKTRAKKKGKPAFKVSPTVIYCS